MALTFIGTTAFAQSGPEQWRLGQFDLDQMSVPFSGAATGLTTYVSSLTRGSAWSGDANVYLTGWTVSDSNKQYPSVTLEYLGAKAGVMPAAKQDYEEQVQSATSSRSNAGVTLTSPMTLQYYSPGTVYSWWTASAPGDPSTVTVADPPTEPRAITVSTGDTTFAVGTVLQEIVDEFFTPQLIDTFQSLEIVAGGKYYQNTIRRSKFLSPWIFADPAGAYFGLFTPGNGYSVGGIVYIYGTHGNGSVQITSVGIGNSITNWTQLSNTFTESEYNLASSGGGGTGARFNAIVIS